MRTLTVFSFHTHLLGLQFIWAWQRTEMQIKPALWKCQPTTETTKGFWSTLEAVGLFVLIRVHGRRALQIWNEPMLMLKWVTAKHHIIFNLAIYIKKMGLILLLLTYQELAAACNAESDDMEVKFMSILCTRSFPHLRKGKDPQRTQAFKKYMHGSKWWCLLTCFCSSQYSRSLSDSPTKTLNRSLRRRCRGMWKTAFML